jgi:hypothetical protein
MGGMSHGPLGGRSPTGRLELGSELEPYIVESVGKRQQRLEQEQRERHIEFLTDLLSAVYDKGATYIALVTGAGYVGFFAIWGWVQPYLARWEVLTTALLLGFSLLVFIVWQIYAMMLMGLQQHRFAKAIGTAPEKFDAAVKSHEDAEAKTRVRLAWLWPLVLGLSALPGLAGGLLLLFACARHLITGSPTAG